MLEQTLLLIFGRIGTPTCAARRDCMVRWWLAAVIAAITARAVVGEELLAFDGIGANDINGGLVFGRALERFGRKSLEAVSWIFVRFDFFN